MLVGLATPMNINRMMKLDRMLTLPNDEKFQLFSKEARYNCSGEVVARSWHWKEEQIETKICAREMHVWCWYINSIQYMWEVEKQNASG